MQQLKVRWFLGLRTLDPPHFNVASLNKTS